ncbi:MAG: hypothetical protein QNK60_07205 [Flavobacteriales bacterium]
MGAGADLDKLEIEDEEVVQKYKKELLLDFIIMVGSLHQWKKGYIIFIP